MYVAVLVLLHPTPQLLIKIIPPTSTQELAPLLCGSTSYLCCDTQLTLQVKVTGVSLVPTPCVFVTCSTKFAQRAWAHHVMSATVVFLRHQITMFAVLPIYMYKGVSS